ncbi:Ubiquitin carboxyl-terminal hydrolase 14 [Clydaea vesicula]|uniref:ubiquitinyl hydrolase 1 n=1 Tax=Clydaea vesicula TaxID=447962 RepID=A0AAD5XY16_9FUNG|nr:Ubiquitin carboxyl-terminal hydrolase 14 [Clydaea vesicula]
MAASLQCLRAIPELSLALEGTQLNATGDQLSGLCTSLRELLKQISKASDTVHPYAFVHLLRQVLPRFNERTAQGFVQQDAEEFWGELISVLRTRLHGFDKENKINETEKFINQYLSGEMLITLKCDEAPNEEPTVSTDTFQKLTVNIGSGVHTYMVTDIQNGLTQPVEKNSPSLGRSAMYTQTSRITRLPYYLVTNFVRFQWKASDNVKAKILKRVKFPFELDIGLCCTHELQEKFAPARQKLKELDDKRADEKKLKKDPELLAKEEAEKANKRKGSKVLETHQDRLKIYEALGIDKSLREDIGANVSGFYDLVAVLTHVGRTAESGHYIGWVKNENGDWFKYDDDKVSPCSQEDISKLEGGGDWHSAYICLYKSKIMDKENEIEILSEIARLLDVDIDRESLSICMKLCENGVNPEALAQVFLELKSDSQQQQQQ